MDLAFNAEELAFQKEVRDWIAANMPAEVAEDVVAESPVDDHADAVVTALHVQDALAVLSPAHRAVLEQVYLNDCTAKEAAFRLGIPEGTAFSRAFYALRVLRRELGVAAAAECSRTAA